MPERTRPTRTPAVAAVLVTGALLTACATTPKPDAPAPGGASGRSTVPAAAATLGGPGSACALPVSFALAEDWEPEAIEDPEDPEFAALTRQGPATVRCEVDAKPAGNIGYLRVWTAPKGSAARAALEGFVTAEKGSAAASYRETRAGALPATEVTYSVGPKEERAFAVATPKATVIVHLGGLDTDEHRAMLPAYELARTTAKAL
ncbi:lipoprotein [Streptomyces sp. NPDC002185]|uniref:lipoprotein n=1 Tax=Streptomyces sp. NPDC002185 TaxID=3364636 RepID=UPI0036A82349